MKVLINNGAQAGVSFLMAAGFGRVDVMAVVLDHSNQGSGSMHFALILAAALGTIDCLKFLLEHMESINPYHLQYALECARHHDQGKCVKLLDEAMSKSGARKFLDEETSEAEAKAECTFEIPNSMAHTQTRDWLCVVS